MVARQQSAATKLGASAAGIAMARCNVECIAKCPSADELQFCINWSLEMAY